MAWNEWFWLLQAGAGITGLNRNFFSRRTLNSNLSQMFSLWNSKSYENPPNSEADRTLMWEKTYMDPLHEINPTCHRRDLMSWSVYFAQMGLPVANPTANLTFGKAGFNPNASWPVQSFMTATSFLPGAVFPHHLAGNYFISWNTMKVGLREKRKVSTVVSGNKGRLNAYSETNPISNNMDPWKDSVQQLWGQTEMWQERHAESVRFDD